MKIQKKFLISCLMISTVFLLASCSKRSTGSGIVQYRMGTGMREQEETKEEQEPEAVTKTDGDLYILTRIDAGQKTAAFEKVTSGRQVQYGYDTATRFLNKYGDTRAIDSFLPGDVVELEVSNSSQKLLRVQNSDAVWVYEDIVNYSVDESIHAMMIGQTRYSYDPGMDIFSGDGTIGFANLGEADVLRAIGTENRLISLAVSKGHGYLALSNTKLFEGSFICVGDRIFEEVTPNMQLEVPEGTYLVTVANDGYGGSREVVIERDETTALDLDELKGAGPKICKVTFDVSVEGATLFIDGAKADYSKPVELRYGVHTITVEAEGYDAITKNLVANSEEAEIEITLNAASGSQTASDDETKSDADGNNNGNNSNNNDNSSNNNGNNNSNNSNNNSNNNNNNNTSSNGTSETDYLTTLYNLLTSMNNTNNTNNGTNNSTNNGSISNTNGSGTDRSYDDLRDE